VEEKQIAAGVARLARAAAAEMRGAGSRHPGEPAVVAPPLV
jgi:hypothetical protein